MGLEELLARLDELGVTLVTSGLRTILRLPLGVPERVRREIADAARRHRDAVMRHLGAGDDEPDDGEGDYCSTCRGYVFSTDDEAGMWRCCRRVDCPRLTPNNPAVPDWLPAYRAKLLRSR
jgi:hypothetical protein